MPTCSACGRDNPDVARFCLACGALLEAAAPERRKLATLLFCDVTGSTALGERTDAETVRELMFRYFHEMRAAVERHGGTVEKFVGDAVMAAFGIPEAHEDDALRACRAALEMQERMTALAPELDRRFGTRLQARIGINTGEVVAGAGAETFATGDAVNVAARLEQAAEPGEVVIGEPTLALVGRAVEVEQLAPLQAKGKAEPLMAFRLRSVSTRVPLAAGAAAFVGRRDELRTLVEAFDEAARERRTRLITLVGEPGVGKSRLVSELERAVAGRVLRGRCLSYGDGITFWPLAEIVREAASIRDEDSAEQARTKLEGLAEPEVAPRIAALVGLGGAVAAEEVGWAVRRFVTALAAERPLVLLVEDVHWAEQTLLDLLVGLEGLAAPVLVVATARPELLESRPDWPGVVRLEPLGAEATTDLLAQLLERDPDDTLVQRAGGNPLFVHELAALLRQGGDPRTLPASLSALLAARLDRLPEPERDALERASVEGELFHRGAVAALLETDVREASDRVGALVEREFAFPAEARLVDEAAFRFRHVLVRDAAYAGLVKRLRAQLHERLADWLERKAGDRLAEMEEIVGYHLEQSYRYGQELGQEVEAVRERAADRLYAAGLRAHERGDPLAAVNLLQRAVDLTHDASQRTQRLPRLAAVLFLSGAFERVEPVLSEAERLAAELGDRRAEMFVRLDRAQYDPDRDRKTALAVAEAAIPVFEEAGDDLGLAKAWAAIADSHYARGQLGRQDEAFQRSLLHARRAGDRALAAHVVARMSATLRWGPYHVDEAIERIERELRDEQFPPHARAVWTAFCGELEASRGNIERGRELCRVGRMLAEEIGDSIAAFWVGTACVEVELLAGDVVEAERLARENLEVGRGWPEMWRIYIARLLLQRDRIDEAEEMLPAVPRDEDDEWPESRAARALLLAHRGELNEAEHLARELVEFYATTDAEPLRAGADRVLGEVLRLAGRPVDAREALERALRIEEGRGATLLAERTSALLAELE